MDEPANQFDREQHMAERLNRQTSKWEKKCEQCGMWFWRDRVHYDYEVCPECLERNRAQRDAPKTEEQVRARREADWTGSILEFCRICQKSFKASLTDTPAPKICPACKQRGECKTCDDS